MQHTQQDIHVGYTCLVTDFTHHRLHSYQHLRYSLTDEGASAASGLRMQQDSSCGTYVLLCNVC